SVGLEAVESSLGVGANGQAQECGGHRWPGPSRGRGDRIVAATAPGRPPDDPAAGPHRPPNPPAPRGDHGTERRTVCAPRTTWIKAASASANARRRAAPSASLSTGDPDRATPLRRSRPKGAWLDLMMTAARCEPPPVPLVAQRFGRPYGLFGRGAAL